MVRENYLVLRVLGTMTAGHDAACAPPIHFSTRKVRALLAFLALSPDQSAAREQLASLLWGGSTDQQARQSLRQALVLLRKDTHPLEIIEADAHTVRLRKGSVWVDALELEALAASDRFDALSRAAVLFRGELLAGLSIREEAFENWLVQQLRHFETVGCNVLERYAIAASASGKGHDAVAAAERLLQLDPLREDWQRLVLRLYASHRGRHEALTRAEAFADLLRRELGVAPEAETRKLVASIRQGPLIPAAADAQRPLQPVSVAASTDEAPSAHPAHGGEPMPAIPVGASFLIQRARQIAATGWAAAQTFARSRTQSVRAVEAVGAGAVFAALLAVVMHGHFLAPVPVISALSVAELAGASNPLTHASPQDAATDRFENGLVTLAVMPFTSNDEDGSEARAISDPIALLLTDEITNTLATTGALRVISRQTASTFSNQKVDAIKVGAELGVAYLLEGSVSMRGSNMRINVGLVDAKSGLRVWSRRFDRSGQDRLAVQEEIVNGLGRELQVEVTRITGEFGSRASDVHLTVLQGWSKMYATGVQGKAALQDAERLFSQALDRDPGNARGQLGLAAYHVNMAMQLFAPDPEAHLVKAEAMLRALIKRRPHMGPAHTYMGLVHFARGHFAEAKIELKKAIELSPSSAPSYAQLGRVLLRMGQTQDALDHILYAIRLSPRDPGLPYWLGLAGAAELERGAIGEAIAYFDRAVSLNPHQPRNVVALAAAQALAGNLDAARRGLEQLQREQPHLNREKLAARFANGSTQVRRGLELAFAAGPLPAVSASAASP